MWLLCHFGLVDSTMYLGVLPCKDRILLGPHFQDDLCSFTSLGEACCCVGKGITVRPIFLFVPTRIDTQIDADVTERIDSAGHLGEQGRVPITGAGHHLIDSHMLCVARQSGGAGSTFKGHLLAGGGNRVEVVIGPDRVKAERFGFLGNAGHHFVGLDRIGNARQVQAPALRN